MKHKKEKPSIESLGGALAKYANPKKRKLEDKAWKLHIKEKFTKKLKSFPLQAFSFQPAYKKENKK